MKYLKFAAAVFLLMLIAAGCSKKYPDYEQYINDIINAQDEFLSRIGSASSAEDIAASAEWFSVRLLELDKTGRSLKEKYPESAGWESAPPESLKDDWIRFHAKWSEFEERWNLEISGDHSYQRMLYDPEVREAFMKLARTMDSVSFL
ncbi:MAG TPA: hypothetical protein PK986_05180 [Spirochaetota bacterium]|nr:hypothetical protein [Spirochaetota bacterium]HQO39842.1 hypothetical protein [Spirochaetota bacterium]